MNSFKIIQEEDCVLMQTYVIWKMYYRDLRTDRTRECIFRAFRGTILKMYPVNTNHGSAFVDLIYVLVCPQKTHNMSLGKVDLG